MRKINLMILGTLVLSANAMAATCSLEESTGVVTCSGTGTATINTSGDGAIDKTKIKKIIVEEGVTSIGSNPKYGLNGATNLTTLVLPSTLKSVGRFAFYGATNLTDMILPDGLETIAYAAFQYTAVQNFIVPASVTSISGAAFGGSTSVFFEGTPTVEAWHSGANNIKVYCSDGGTSCISCDDCPTPTAYTIGDNGEYIVGTGDDAKYYASRDLLIYDKPCADKKECDTMINAVRAGKSFISGGKFYNSLSDWLKGKHEKKRIYMVDEAEAVTGRKNTIKIRYK